ncbi:MAG: chorismate synthase [Spirochaetia bacterium]|nr:chorismate synthase [Spirochaetia bacterium]
MGSSLGRLFKITTYGESHGKAVGCVIENCPAGLILTEKDIQPDLDRRRPGQSALTTPRKEPDTVEILSGTFQEKTIGSPISLIVYNKEAKESDYADFKDIYRPSHADFTYHQRYGYRTYVGGGRASARSTIGVTAAGAVAKKILKEKLKTDICAYVSQIHDLILPNGFDNSNIKKIRDIAEKNDIRCPDLKLAEKMTEKIKNIKKEGDSLGGVIELIADNVPAGLGDPVFDRMDALLAQAMMAIPAVKGVEIGSGFSAASMKGSEHNDLFFNEKGKIRTRTNYSGGIQGGITNGERIFMRIAFKPTATIRKEMPTVSEKGEEVILKAKGRHDPCVLPRAVPIVEAFAALVFADQYLISKTANYNKL